MLSLFFSTAPLILLGIAAVVSLRAFMPGGTTPLRMFSGACMLTLAVELTGHFLKSLGPSDRAYQVFYGSDPATGQIISNHWLYNIFNFLYCMILAITFYHQLKDDTIKIIIQFFYVAFTILFLTNTIFFQGIISFQTLLVVTGGGFVMFLSGAYFWDLLMSQEHEKIIHDPFFWFSFGLIVYFGGTIPFLGMFNFLADKFYDFTAFYQMYFSNGFSIFLSSLIITGFLCRKNYLKLS